MSDPTSRPIVDPRDSAAFLAEFEARLAAYLPEWRPAQGGPDEALGEVLAHYLAAIATRLNRVPDKHQLALLDLLGVGLISARSARAPVVFTLTDNANDSQVPAGTRLAAAPSPTQPADGGTAGPLLFEVERSTGLASAKLVELRSLWPGRDQSIDHWPAASAGLPFQLWRLSELEDQPHHFYIAHPTLLALAGQSHLVVLLEMSQGSSKPLDAVWEYWDGEGWRPFANSIDDCDPQAAAQQDSTGKFMKTGAVHLLTEAAETKPAEIDGTKSYWVRGRLTAPLLPDPAMLLPEVEQVRLSTVITRPVSVAAGTDPSPPVITGGLLPDLAIVEGAPADLTRPIYPFGMQPQPGSAFYLSCAEAFSKPGADLQLCFVRTVTPQDLLSAGRVTTNAAGVQTTTTAEPLPHLVAWEYWNGTDWTTLPGPARNAGTDPEDLDPPADEPFGTVTMTVPADLEPTTVADVEAPWIRARLASGGYGFQATVTWSEGGAAGAQNTLTYVVSRPPAIAALKLGYSWTYGPFFPEKVLTYNDFQYTDRTHEAIWPGEVFRPFVPPADATPALYLGFDKPLPVDELGIFFDVEEVYGDTVGPAQIWEFWDGGAWRRLTVSDETNRLRVPGLVGLIGPGASRPLNRFGTERTFLRVRLAEDGPPGSPVIDAVYPNAAWAAQQQTILAETIGTGTGVPAQVLAFPQFPVLPGEQIEVREFAGPRAAAEWRVVAHELFPGDERVIGELERLLGQEGAADVEYPPLRLRRDRTKQVSEVWVRWESRNDLADSGPADRHYLLEHTQGLLQFGDGRQGRIPAPGAAVVARRYQTGGGLAGNVATGAISQLQAAIGGVAAVTNPVPAEGGADAETPAALRSRGPATLRHRGRGLSARDLETLAREASPAVAVARVLPARSTDGRHHPGHVTVVIIPSGADPRPWPSFGLREAVREYLEARAGATTAALHRIEVTGPQYLPVDVEATLVTADPNQAGAVEEAAIAAVGTLLHPLLGGPDATGWPPGRSVYLSDVAAVLDRVPGLDHVEGLAISVGGQVGGDSVTVPADHTVVAGELRLAVAQA
jgi:hypothetical protein